MARVLYLCFVCFVCFASVSVLSSCGQDFSRALGTLERERIAHTATASEVVMELPIKEGQFVTKGAVLVRLNTQQQMAQVEQAKANVARADAYLDKLHNGARIEEVEATRALVEGARASLLDIERNFVRQQELFSQNLTSQVKLDTTQARRDSARANLRNTQEQLLQLTNGTREEDLRMAQAERKAAQAVLESELKRLNDLTIVASRNGILDSLPWNEGERVTIGSPLAIVLAGKVPYARVYVPEPSRVNVKIGSQLAVYIDGIDESFVGTVRWISSEPAFTPYYALNQEERSRLVYLAEIDLPDSAAELPSGVPAQVIMP